MAKAGRPKKEFDKKQFINLIGIGCGIEEICWCFRDDTGKLANRDTISRWCKREFGMDFKAYKAKNGGMMARIQLRHNQLELSKKSAAMAIFLGKNLLGQSDNPPATLGDGEISAQNAQVSAIADLINNPVEESESSGDLE